MLRLFGAGEVELVGLVGLVPDLDRGQARAVALGEGGDEGGIGAGLVGGHALALLDCPGTHARKSDAGAEEAQHGVLSTIGTTPMPSAAASLISRSEIGQRARFDLIRPARLEFRPRHFDAHDLRMERVRWAISRSRPARLALRDRRCDVDAAREARRPTDALCAAPRRPGRATRTRTAQRKREEDLERASGHARARASCPSAVASCHRYRIVVGVREAQSTRPAGPSTLSRAMSPFWIWTQVAIVVFVLIGMIIAITKLA